MLLTTFVVQVRLVIEHEEHESLDEIGDAICHAIDNGGEDTFYDVTGESVYTVNDWSAAVTAWTRAPGTT